MGIETKLERKCREHASEKGYINVKMLTKGWPDRQFFGQGRSFFVEFKTDIGRLSVKQDRTITKLDRLGHLCFTVDSFEQFKRILQSMPSQSSTS